MTSTDSDARTRHSIDRFIDFDLSETMFWTHFSENYLESFQLQNVTLSQGQFSFFPRLLPRGDLTLYVHFSSQVLLCLSHLVKATGDAAETTT